MQYSISETSQATGISKSRLSKMILEGKITATEDKIDEQYVDQLLKEKQDFISLYEYTRKYDSEKFKADLVVNRRKIQDELEKNQYYGLSVKYANSMLIGTKKDIVFFRREDVQILDEKLTPFFSTFGLTEEEKIAQLIANTTGHEVSKQMLRKYRDEMMYEDSITPSHTAFVDVILMAPDVSILEDKDIAKIITPGVSPTVKGLLVSYLNYVKRHTKTQYSAMMITASKSNGYPAYDDDTYLELASCVFNSEYIAEHEMIEKALSNHLYIEMWLFIAIHFTCGWRAEDICQGWKYLNLKESPKFNINTETLYEDILYDRIPESTYEDVCTYAIQSIDVSNQLPGKTSVHNPLPLKMIITPTLRPFFGLLTLIAESVMLRSGDGYMKNSRASLYQKKMNIKHFFGERMYYALDGANLMSRRLNKDYLQGIELSAKETGAGAVLASAVASYARNHISLDTISHYLHDHKLTGESAEMVLYMMMERGVFGFEAYQALVTAYPEAMHALPIKKQNELISMVQSSPYQIEMEETGNDTRYYVKDQFLKGNSETILQILTDMFELSQNRGKAKDDGVYCIARVRKEVCANPEYKSCLANACPYLIFTRYGYGPLVEVIRDYRLAANKGNAKAAHILKSIILPRYRDILNTLMREREMDQDDKNGMKKIMEDILHEQHS